MDAAPGQTTEARADLPLAGMRVIAVEQYGAGPFGTMHLADLGAEVIKIEQPDTGGAMPGDNARHSDTRKLGKNDSQFFQSFNRNKKSVALDLKQDAGQEAFRRLVAGADAVLNNLRGDIPAKLGVDYAALSAVKPAIVCVHVSGYGRSGDRARWPAYDYLLQAEAGFMSVTGEPDGVPTRMGLSMVDYATGITAALALVSAVMGARATGRGRDFDVTLYDTAMHLLTYPAAWWLNAGYETARRPRSGHPHIVPCEVYPTADGEVIVMCVKPKFWELLAEELGLAALIDDPRFKTNADRFENRDALAAEMDAAFRKATTADWLARLSGKVPVSPVRSLGDALDNDFFVSRGGAQSVPHPHAPDMRLVANPIRPEGKVLPARAGPALGADTDACLRDAGYDEDEIARLHAEKVVS